MYLNDICDFKICLKMYLNDICDFGHHAIVFASLCYSFSFIVDGMNCFVLKGSEFSIC